MEKLCKDCDEYKRGFSPLCKYCENDGKCPECEEPLRWGTDTPYVCLNGHKFDVYGRSIKDWNPSER